MATKKKNWTKVKPGTPIKDVVSKARRKKAVKKKTAKKKVHKKPGLPARITKRNQDLIDALCQVPTPTLKEAAASLNMSYGGARQMLIRPIVLEALEAQRAKISERAQEIAAVDKSYVLETSKELVERCMQHSPVRDKNGEQVYVETAAGDIVPAYQFDAAGAARGLKLIGDHIQVSAFKPLDDDGKPVDQNWRITFVDAATGKQTVHGPGSGESG